MGVWSHQALAKRPPQLMFVSEVEGTLARQGWRHSGVRIGL